MLYANRLLGAVGADDLAERSIRGGDEGETREAGLSASAVEPDYVFAVAVPLSKDGLRLAPFPEPQVVNSHRRGLLWRIRWRRCSRRWARLGERPLQPCER